MATKTEDIRATAADAQRWLGLRQGNRRISQVKVGEYTQAMIRGEWRESDSAICIEGSGRSARLINGQHRALALIAADAEAPGISVPLTVKSGMPVDVGVTMDTGRPRSVEDTLDFLAPDEPRHRLVAAALTLAWHVTEGTYANRLPTPTRPQLTDFLKQHTDLAEIVPLGAQVGRSVHMPQPGLTVAFWLISHGSEPERLDTFATEIAYGEGLTSRDATYRIRQTFATWAATRNVDRGRPWKVCALTIRAWRMYVGTDRLARLERVRLAEIPEVP